MRRMLKIPKVESKEEWKGLCRGVRAMGAALGFKVDIRSVTDTEPGAGVGDACSEPPDVTPPGSVRVEVLLS